MLPPDTPLGKLEMIKVYEYYDRPVLFTCKGDNEHLIYLVVLDREFDEGEAYLYCPMTHERHEELKQGQMDLYHAFRDNEFGYVYEVKIFRDGRQTEMDAIKTYWLNDGDLPVRGEKLSQ